MPRATRVVAASLAGAPYELAEERPRPVHRVAEDHDVSVPDREVGEDATGALALAFLVVAQVVELEPETLVGGHTVGAGDLGSEEVVGEVGGQQLPLAKRCEEGVQVAGGAERTTVGCALGWIGVEVLFESSVVGRVEPLGEVGDCVALVEVAGAGHAGAREHLGLDVFPEALARGVLDGHPCDDVAGVAVARPAAWREVWRLVREQGQEVAQGHDRVTRHHSKDLGVVLALVLLGDVGDAAGVREQVAQRDRGGDGGAGEVGVLVDRRVEVQPPSGDQLQHRDRGEQLADRGDVETYVERVRYTPAR